MDKALTSVHSPLPSGIFIPNAETEHVRGAHYIFKCILHFTLRIKYVARWNKTASSASLALAEMDPSGGNIEGGVHELTANFQYCYWSGSSTGNWRI